jgi:hypothetical protein
MKKSILLVAMCLSMSVIVSSCKGEKKEASEETEMHENHAADKADIAMLDVYKCPMDCEDGKTYDKEGKCPKCEMDLKKVEKEGTHEHENGEKHENHDNDENHTEDHDSKEGHDKDEDSDKGHEG